MSRVAIDPYVAEDGEQVSYMSPTHKQDYINKLRRRGLTVDRNGIIVKVNKPSSSGA